MNLVWQIVCKSIPNRYIFCYHRIIPREIADQQFVHRALYVTPETFERHVAWMKSHGEIVNIDGMMTHPERKMFMITFDDGWKDNFTHAFPILKKYNVPATIFISTNNIDNTVLFWSEELTIHVGKALATRREEIIGLLQEEILSILYDYGDTRRIEFNQKCTDPSYLLDRFIECLKLTMALIRQDILSSFYFKLGVHTHINGSYYLLSWDEIRTISNYGIEFGSHTHTHELLDRVDNRTIDYELKESKHRLESELGKEVRLFSYPNGYFQNHAIQKALRKNGYQYAFTLDSRTIFTDDDPLLLPRCLLFEDISQLMNKYFLRLVLTSIRKRSGLANGFVEFIKKIRGSG
jgi:peptidoglycan/xylan/chitin deacetylase (PgdA/CDA1 family)